MTRIAAIASLTCGLVIAGCQPRERIVSVPTPVACFEATQIPSEPESVRDSLTGNASRDSAILAVAVLEWREYAGKLGAILRGCVR